MKFKDILFIIKYKPISLIDNFITMHTTVCPKCYKMWHQLKKYIECKEWCAYDYYTTTVLSSSNIR